MLKKIVVFLITFCCLFPLTAKAGKIEWQNKVISTLNYFSGSSPEIAYGHGRYGVVFDDQRSGSHQVYLALLKPNGGTAGENINISSSSSDAFEPTISWDGSNFGIFWSEASQVKFAQVSTKGEIVTGPKIISENAIHVSAVWNQSLEVYGVVWYGTDNAPIPGARFVRVSQEGGVIDNVIPLSSVNDRGQFRPLIATSGSDYGVTWNSNRNCSAGICPNPVFTVVNSQGLKIFNDNLLTSYTFNSVRSIIWGGSQYALVTLRTTGIFLYQVDNIGIINSIKLTQGYVNTNNIGLAWQNDHYLISYCDIFSSDSGPNYEIVIAKYDQEGNLIDNSLIISDSINDDQYPSNPLISGNSLAVVWIGNLGEPDQNITFAQQKKF